MKSQHVNKLWILLATFLTVALITPTAFAQQKQDAGLEKQHKMREGMKHRGKMMKELMPPRKLLKHADAIGLTAAQRTEITKIEDDFHKTAEKIQAEIQTESDKLNPLLAAAKPDTNAALRQADRVFAAENKLKRARLESMLRTKSVLTADQVSKIDALRKDRSEHRGDKKRGGKSKEQLKRDK